MNAYQRRTGEVSVETEFVIKMHGKSASHVRTDGPNFILCSNGNVIVLCPCLCK